MKKLNEKQLNEINGSATGMGINGNVAVVFDPSDPVLFDPKAVAVYTG